MAGGVMAALTALSLKFRLLPSLVDVAIIPTFAATLAAVSGLTSYVLRPADDDQLARDWLEGAVVGGSFGLVFFFLGLLGIF